MRCSLFRPAFFYGISLEGVSAARSRQTINAIENNKYDPTLTLAFHLAGVLGTTVDELFLGPGEKSC